MSYDRISVALASMDDEDNVIHEAVRMTRAFEATLTVLHVNAPKAGEMTMMMDAERLVKEEELRKQFRKLGYNTDADNLTFNILTGIHLPTVLAEATRDTDLLVIGHSPKNRFLAAFAGAADKHLTDLISCPVLIVPRS